MSLATFGPGSFLVGRATDIARLIAAPVVDWQEQPGARVVVLPDSATVADIRAVLAALGASAGAAGGPTGAPPG